MKWLRRLLDWLFSVDVGQPRVIFSDRAEGEEAVRQCARHLLLEVASAVRMGHPMPGDVVERRVPLRCSFNDEELHRICRDEVSNRYGVRVSGGVLTIEYVVDSPF